MRREVLQEEVEFLGLELADGVREVAEEGGANVGEEAFEARVLGEAGVPEPDDGAPVSRRERERGASRQVARRARSRRAHASARIIIERHSSTIERNNKIEETERERERDGV